LTSRKVDIRAAVDAAVLGVQDRIAEKGVLLDVRAAPDIGSFLADERRVRQILFNLLSNAISFSPRGEVVRVRRAPRRRGDLQRDDRGPGIPAGDQRARVRPVREPRASARSIAARVSGFRSCVPSSSCMVVR
jgi:signal transduction histidine kinase